MNTNIVGALLNLSRSILLLTHVVIVLSLQSFAELEIDGRRRQEEIASTTAAKPRGKAVSFIKYLR